MFDVSKPGLRKYKRRIRSLNNKDEFRFYLRLIKKVMDPRGSFLELGSESFSLSSYLEDITIFDKNPEVLEKYSTKKILHGDYLSLTILHNSFDYVIAIHPNLYNSESNIEWFDHEKTNFKFKDSHLEDFVLSLLNTARKKVLIASKAITDNPPMRRLVRMIGDNPYFVIYEKPVQGGKNGKP